MEPNELLATAEEFKSTMKSTNRILPVRKELLSAVLAKEAQDGSIDFILSTATADRSNDCVDQAGWDTAAYSKNSVVLWAHDHGAPPVAKPGLVGVENGCLVAKGCTFTERDLYQFGWMIGEMYRKGFLNAVSVGFRPLEFSFSKERGDYAMDFKRQELLEFSCVPVPANAEALVSAKSAGIDVAPMIEWAEKILDTQDPESRAKLLVPREYVEKLWATAKRPTTISLPIPPKSEAAATAPTEAKAGAVAGDPAAAPSDSPGAEDVCDSCSSSCSACGDAVEACSDACECGCSEDVAAACDECAAACLVAAEASDAHGAKCAGYAASLSALASAAKACAAGCRAALEDPKSEPTGEMSAPAPATKTATAPAVAALVAPTDEDVAERIGRSVAKKLSAALGQY